MRGIRIHLTIVVVTLMLIALLEFDGPSLPAGASRLESGFLATAQGANPSYYTGSTRDFCMRETIFGGQVTAWSCSGNEGAPCVDCTGMMVWLTASTTGLPEPPAPYIQPSGGADVSCDSLTKKAGQCYDGNCISNPTGDQCEGMYPPFVYQPF